MQTVQETIHTTKELPKNYGIAAKPSESLK